MTDDPLVLRRAEEAVLDAQMMALGSVRALLGCDWGRKVAAPDDAAPCQEQARQIIVMHAMQFVAQHGGKVLEVKLCPRHADRVLRDTTPHEAR